MKMVFNFRESQTNKKCNKERFTQYTMFGHIKKKKKKFKREFSVHILSTVVV